MKNIKIGIRYLLVLLVLGSCSKMDDYKGFLEGKSFIYAGGADTVIVAPGDGRVQLNMVMGSDPNLRDGIIYWNNRSDSVSFSVKSAGVNDTIHQIIPIPEGNYSFEIYTFNDDGFKSVPYFATGKSYGSRYKATLINRAVTATEGDDDGNVSINWSDTTESSVGVNVYYTDGNGDQQMIFVPNDNNRTDLTGYASNTEFSYQTLYLPEENAIDTFATDMISVLPKFPLLRNLGPFSYASWDGARWGILSAWSTTSDIRNAGGYGGYELRGGVPVLSIESGWGLPAIPNGKIYQTVTLDPGEYVFTPTVYQSNSGGTVYMAVAEGDALPDFANVASESLAYVQLAGAASRTLSFELTDATKITIGFVANMAGGGGVGQYYKFTKIEFEKVE